MNIEMTKAILDGRKTQTRRIIKDKLIKPVDSKFPDNEMYLDSYNNFNKWFWWTQDGRQNLSQCIISRFKKGDILWVREPVKIDMCFTEEIHFHYLSDNTTSKLNIPKRFIKEGFVADWMAHCQGVPNGCIKEMARIFLKITDVRVERLQDISIEDIRKEGCNSSYLERIELWNKTAPKGYKWGDNPYVFVYEFKRVNEDGSKYE